MAKEMVGARIDREIKVAIEAEALRDDRKPGWLYAKLLLMGWQHYQQTNGRKRKLRKAS